MCRRHELSTDLERGDEGVLEQLVRRHALQDHLRQHACRAEPDLRRPCRDVCAEGITSRGSSRCAAESTVILIFEEASAFYRSSHLNQNLGPSRFSGLSNHDATHTRHEARAATPLRRLVLRCGGTHPGDVEELGVGLPRQRQGALARRHQGHLYYLYGNQLPSISFGSMPKAIQQATRCPGAPDAVCFTTMVELTIRGTVRRQSQAPLHERPNLSTHLVIDGGYSSASAVRSHLQQGDDSVGGIPGERHGHAAQTVTGACRLHDAAGTKRARPSSVVMYR